MSTVEETAADRLSRMLRPRSIAVVGASANPAKRGYQAVAALAGYPGAVYPVNPAGGQILGHPVYRRLADIPTDDRGQVDLVLVATPAATVPAVLADAGSCGAAGAVVLAVGFGESGPAGQALEDEIRAVLAGTGLRMIGPNTSGLLDLPAGINLVGLRDVPAGPIGLLSQSGNMLLSMAADLRAARLPGLSGYIGLGNQVDVGYHELLPAVAAQPEIRALAVHCEGIRRGREFLRAAATVTPHTPVVLLKGGNSAAGRRAAQSHTGALAAPAALSRALLTQAGVEVVERSDELAVVAGTLATAPVPTGDRVAVLADGGGHGTLAADALAAAGVPLAELGEATRDRLRALLGPAAAVTNPVDVAGATDTEPGLFADCARLLLTDPAVDILLVVGLFGGYHLRFGEHLTEAETAAAHALTGLPAGTGAPILVQTCYAAEPAAGLAGRPLAVLRDAGIPVLPAIDHAARCCLALARRSEFLRTAEDRCRFAPVPISSTVDGVALTEDRARLLLERAGIDTGAWRVARDPAEAVRAVRELGGRCALKVLSPQVVHKSEVSGVRLGVTPGRAAAEYQALCADVSGALPDADIEGALLTPMADRGVELLIGATRDATFGPVLAVGPGGTMVELLDDLDFRAVPLTPLEATELLDRGTTRRLLSGFRGAPVAYRPALVDFLVRVSQLLADHPEILELDLNPVLVNGSTCTPLDVRIVLGTGQPD